MLTELEYNLSLTSHGDKNVTRTARGNRNVLPNYNQNALKVSEFSKASICGAIHNGKSW
uniref:Uncharacterized protein n=1 Tax=Mesocestoides corti TaxID=53468 RepID=A0A5K3FZV7_MESCO